MKLAQWNEFSEISLSSELANLKEIEANLEALSASTNGDFSARSKVAEALSFVQQAASAISGSYGVADAQDKTAGPT
jgi:hypothetical protein